MVDMKPTDQLQSEIEELLDRIENEEKHLAEKHGESYHPTIPTLCSRMMALEAVLTEASSRRLVRLTWALLFCTVALLSVEVRAVFFPKDSAAHVEAKQTGQDHQVMVPALTNAQHTK
jgi:hypothetical protein